MLAYLEKHTAPKDIHVWRPILYDGRQDMSTWSCVQDRFGKIIIGGRVSMKIGADYDFGPHIIPWNSRKGLPPLKQKVLNVLGRITAQVSMRDAEQLAGQRLPHQPYCYEVVCD